MTQVWQACLTDDGLDYYVNTETNETSYGALHAWEPCVPRPCHKTCIFTRLYSSTESGSFRGCRGVYKGHAKGTYTAPEMSGVGYDVRETCGQCGAVWRTDGGSLHRPHMSCNLHVPRWEKPEELMTSDEMNETGLAFLDRTLRSCKQCPYLAAIS